MAAETQRASVSVQVEDAFALSSGVTVFVVRTAGIELAPWIAPCRAELVVGGRSCGDLEIVSERMGGTRAGVRALETADMVDVDAVRSQVAVLRLFPRAPAT